MKVVSFLVSLFLCQLISAQAFMTEVTKNACLCADQYIDSLKGDELNMALGLCMLDAIRPYKKEFLKEFKLNIDRADEQGEEIGRLMGMRMAGVCPQQMIKLAQINQAAPPPIKEPESLFISSGTVSEVENNTFMSVLLTDQQGKPQRFYWLNPVNEGGDLLMEQVKLKGLKLEVTYDKQEFFDPSLGEYRFFNVIRSVRTLNN